MGNYISREEALNTIKEYAGEYTFNTYYCGMMNARELLCDIPAADVVASEKLLAEIKQLKASIKPLNQAHYMGYMCALSTVEGIIASLQIGV